MLIVLTALTGFVAYKVGQERKKEDVYASATPKRMLYSTRKAA